jgi:hypothetical protein
MDYQLTTPIVFLIFNRPDTTFKVFEAIREAKPQKLLVIADGARSPEEIKKCNEARSIINRVDWNCEVLTNFSDVNLGCRLRVSSGLDWAFSEVEEAIILEDDCLPHSTFFYYCEELLQLYRNNAQIMNVLGSNFLFNRKQISKSYYFSRYTSAWGWATWKRAWHFYDVEMEVWPTIQENKFLDNFLDNKQSVKYWTKIFNSVYTNQIDTWDYHLISNIGFSPQATHTKEKNCKYDSMPTEPMRFPMTHPNCITRLKVFDDIIEKNLFSQTIVKRAIGKIKNTLGLSYYKN